ncbi:hypothetical protein E2C01_070440 [Portunus trituberculatus]|uniref:Uncharacterized protein n=1 Tax=Portunus trituberculatus TaxID=210409 RepID=A0A5B7I2B0_PORTR|nr:hypothetical protein [Portunus trituberculatus]
MGLRESNFGTVSGLHETVTWRVHETVTWKVHETVTWKGRWRGSKRGSKRRSDQLKDGAEFEVIGDPEQLKKEQAREQEKKEEEQSSSSTSATTPATSLFPPTGENYIRISFTMDIYNLVNDHWERFLSYYHHYYHLPIN